MNHKKKALLSAIVLGALGAVAGATIATFTAQTRNPSNTFSTGTLVLSNTKQGGTTCLSTAGGTTDSNVNNSCDTLLSLSVQKPGDSGTQNLTLKNEGSLAGSSFEVFMAACTASDAAGQTYHGTGNPCGNIQFYIQRWTNSDYTGVAECVYGGATVANTCDFSDATKTLSAFTAAHNSTSSGQSLSGLTAGASKYYTIGVMLPSTADNTMQGRTASFDLTWYLAQ